MAKPNLRSHLCEHFLISVTNDRLLQILELWAARCCTRRNRGAHKSRRIFKVIVLFHTTGTCNKHRRYMRIGGLGQIFKAS